MIIRVEIVVQQPLKDLPKFIGVEFTPPRIHWPNAALLCPAAALFIAYRSTTYGPRVCSDRYQLIAPIWPKCPRRSLKPISVLDS